MKHATIYCSCGKWLARVNDRGGVIELNHNVSTVSSTGHGVSGSRGRLSFGLEPIPTTVVIDCPKCQISAERNPDSGEWSVLDDLAQPEVVRRNIGYF